MTSHHQVPARHNYPINGTGLCRRLCFLAFMVRLGSLGAHAQTTETFATGSFIINLGITLQHDNNGLRPCGLIYDSPRNYQVPIQGVTQPTQGMAYKHSRKLTPGIELQAPDITGLNDGAATIFTTHINPDPVAVRDETGHRIFVSESYNNRVLVYNLLACNNLVDKTPDCVLGQVNLTSNATSIKPQQ